MFRRNEKKHKEHDVHTHTGTAANNKNRAVQNGETKHKKNLQRMIL